MLKMRGLMKDDKVWKLFTKLDRTLLRNDVPWDEINDKQMENLKRNAIGTYLMKEMVQGRIIRTGSTSNGFYGS